MKNNQLSDILPYRYAREFPDPYLSHGIGPVPGYGAMYRGSYNRFTPY